MLSKNTNLFYIIRFFETFVFTTAIWSFFFTSYHHFSFGQALFLITLWWITSLFFEIPSWTWADRFGRKKMYLIGTALLILDLVIWMMSDTYWIFIISWVIWWVGGAMISGNLEALIHDELEEKKEEKKFWNIVANSYSAIFIGRALASASSGFLFVIHPLLPILLTLISYSCIFIMASFLKEPRQILSEHKDTFSHLRETLHFLIKERELFSFVLLIALLSGLGNVYFFTQQPYFHMIGVPVEWIWFTFSVGAWISAIGAFLFKKLRGELSEYTILGIMIGCALIASILYMNFTLAFSLVWLIMLSLMFGYIMTLGNNSIVEKVPKHQKSTMLSVFSFLITIGYSCINILLSLWDGYISMKEIYLLTFFGIGGIWLVYIFKKL